MFLANIKKGIPSSCHLCFWVVPKYMGRCFWGYRVTWRVVHLDGYLFYFSKCWCQVLGAIFNDQSKLNQTLDNPKIDILWLIFIYAAHTNYKRRMQGKIYGTKWCVIGNMLGNTLGTCETHWELNQNMIWTCWESKKIQHPPLHKAKTIGPFGCMYPTFLCLLMFLTIFGPS